MDKITEQKIKDAASVVDVIGDFYELRKKGVNYQCLCPFHPDKHMGSFVVSPRKNTYSCYSCGAHGDAIEFLMSKQGLTYPDALRWLAKKYSIVIPDDAHDEWSDRLNAIIEKAKQAEVRRLEQRQQVKTLYLPVETPAAMMKQAVNSTFVIWLYSLPWNDEQRARLPKMLNNYAIGVSRDGLTVFWQIDEQARVHTGKMMRYKADGHRDKDSDYNFDWVHAKLFRQKVYNEEEYDYETCLFGQHLLPFCPNAQIHLVESEKTALIMATYYGNMSRNLWLATGGLQFFDRKHIQVLIDQGRDIVVYPDKDGSKAWSDRTLQLIKETGYKKLKVNPTIISNRWRQEDGPKADIADITLREMEQKAKAQGNMILRQFISDNPFVGKLVEKLGLEVVEKYDQSRRTKRKAVAKPESIRSTEGKAARKSA